MSRDTTPTAPGATGDVSRPVRIRRATRGDLDAMGRLGAVLVRTHHEFDARRFMPGRADLERGYAAFLGGQLDEPDAVILVADREGEVIGYVYGSMEGTDWMMLRGPAGVLHDIIVSPARRGDGVGRMLLDSAISALEAMGAPRVVLSTAVANDVARRLFTAAGFRPTMIEMTLELAEGGVADELASPAGSDG